MIKTISKLVLGMSVLANVAMATDSQVTGTITLNGVLSPKAISIVLAVNDCGPTATLASCKATLNSATFTGHAQHVTAALGNLVEGQENIRYVQFEAKTKMLLLKNDYAQFISSLSSTTNDITVSLHQLNFVSGGRTTFGQTTLGASGSADLSLNEAMLDSVDVALTGTLTTLWDQSTDNPAAVNSKVFFATANGEELVVRGVLGVKLGEQATSSAYSAVITAGFIAKDN